jgi:hypothetical protein
MRVPISFHPCHHLILSFSLRPFSCIWNGGFNLLSLMTTTIEHFFFYLLSFILYMYIYTYIYRLWWNVCLNFSFFFISYIVCLLGIQLQEVFLCSGHNSVSDIPVLSSFS